MSNSEMDRYYMADVTPTEDGKRATAICDECHSKIDFDTNDYIPEDPAHTHHHCVSCGLIDYLPEKAKSFTAPPERYKHWWGNSRKP